MLKNNFNHINALLDKLIIGARPDVMSTVGFITLSDLVENCFAYSDQDIKRKLCTINESFLKIDKHKKIILDSLKELQNMFDVKLLQPNIYQDNMKKLKKHVVNYWEESQLCVSSNLDLLLVNSGC